LEQVKTGAEIVVTEHGRAVARITGVGQERTIDRLVREGRVIPAKDPQRTLPRRIKATEPVSPLVAEQRQ
jgi:antitoxin (DNA-binding transcriptional repressor) of toxin-antitoxin stability system